MKRGVGKYIRTEEIRMKQRKPRSEEAKANMRKPHGPHSEEHKQHLKENHADFSGKNNPNFKEGKLKILYGLTWDEYNAMLKKQNGLCAICGKPETKKIAPSQGGGIQRLSIDHNHKTGEIRGLLCVRCNTKLGVIEDTEFLLKAIKYLR